MAKQYVDCDGHVMERVDEIAELIGKWDDDGTDRYRLRVPKEQGAGRAYSLQRRVPINNGRQDCARNHRRRPEARP